jgi:PAS domain S-box-containing protein
LADRTNFLKPFAVQPDDLLGHPNCAGMSRVEQPASTGQETAPASQASSEKRSRLLLIQHDPRARITLWDKFKNAGFEVDIAANPHLAVDKLRIAAPDAIFIDLVAANSKALEVIKEARRNKNFATRPIYVCTTAALMATARRVAKAPTRVFDKAATPLDEIVAELTKAVAQHQSEAAAQTESKAGTSQQSKKEGNSKFSLNPVKLLKNFGRKKDEIAEAPKNAAPAEPAPAVPVSADPVAAQADATNEPSARPEPTPPPPPPTLAPPQRQTSRPLVGVFTVDSIGKIVSADGAAATMFGWQAADLVGKGLKVLIKEGSEAEVAKIVQQAGDSPQQLISVHVTARRKSGSEFPASITRLAWSSDTITLSKIGSGSQYTWTAVFRDLSIVPSSNTATLERAPVSSAAPGSAACPTPLDELAESRETQEMLRGANKALQKQLEVMSAKVAASAEAAHNAEEHRNALKARVETLERDVARARAAAEQQAKGSRSSDTQMQQLLTEKFELEQKLEEQRRAQQQAGRISTELAEAKAAAERAEANCKREAARAQSLEEEINRLQQSREGLTAQSKQRSDELESRLRETSAELDRIRAAQRQRESELEAQLVAAQQAEAGLKEKADQCSRLEAELAQLQRVHQELSGNFTAEQRSTAESRQRTEELESRLRESAEELERARAERAREEQGRCTLETSLHQQLSEVKAAVEQAHGQNQRLEEELAALRQQRDELKTAESGAVAEVERRNRELETQLQEALARLQQSAPADTTGESGAEEQKQGRRTAGDTAQSRRLEREVANLRQERHELHAKCVAEKQAGTKAKRRIRELEKQLREIASGFNTAKRELEKRAADRGRLESNLQGELDAAKEGIEQAQAAQHEQTVRANLLERELGQVCEARDELRAELEVEQHKVVVSAQRMEELEGRLRESAAELARARAAAENQAAAGGSQASRGDGDNEEMLKDLFRLRENEAGHAAEVSELERRVRDGVASMARVSADLETERSERRRIEQRMAVLTSQLEQMHMDLKQQLESERNNQTRVTELEEQLRERERLLVRLRAELQKETANRDLIEQQLEAVGDMGAQLRQYLALFEDSKKVFKRTQEQLEGKLRVTQESLGATEAKLQKEISERRGLEESLSTAQRSLNDQYEQKVLELARLQSELQVEQLERKRLEGGAQQSRYASLDSARVARTMLNSLRRQMHDSVDTLMQTTRRLLEISTNQEQKELVQSVLESALVLQTTLDEGSAGPGSDPELRSAA